MTRILARPTMFLLALTLTLSIGAFAASKSQSVTLYHDAQLNGKTLPAGDYTVKCDTTGSTTQVRFIRNGKEVASATGQVKQLTSAPESNQVVTLDGSGGAATITEIDFSNSKSGVSFETSTAMSTAGQ